MKQCFIMDNAHRTALIAEAAGLLGWPGTVVGPVDFAHVRFWAVVDVDVLEHRRRLTVGQKPILDRDQLAAHVASGQRDPQRLRPSPVMRLQGCVVWESDPRASVRDASLLAGYSARAVIADYDDTGLPLLTDAAILDQGVVVRSVEDHLELLSLPGPRVPGTKFSSREWELLERVYASFLLDPLAVSDAGDNGRLDPARN